MDITTDGDWCVNGDDIAFFDQKLTRLVAQFTDLGLGDQAAGPQLLDRPTRNQVSISSSGQLEYGKSKCDTGLGHSWCSSVRGEAWRGAGMDARGGRWSLPKRAMVAIAKSVSFPSEMQNHGCDAMAGDQERAREERRSSDSARRPITGEADKIRCTRVFPSALRPLLRPSRHLCSRCQLALAKVHPWDNPIDPFGPVAVPFGASLPVSPSPPMA